MVAVWQLAVPRLQIDNWLSKSAMVTAAELGVAWLLLGNWLCQGCR
jgi:hypothetical protein